MSAEHLDHVLGLELTGSGITALQAGDFHDLPNVNELRLGRNDLESLPEGVFDGLDGLRKLYLNDNNLSDLPDGVFDRLRSLRRLYLNDNDLSDLPDGAFGQLESLRRLRLNDNDLSELPDGIFDGLTDLRELWLHSNRGAPFTLTVELERRSDTAVVVRVAQGAPFDIEATLSVTGGELSVPTLMTVSISGGSAISDEDSGDARRRWAGHGERVIGGSSAQTRPDCQGHPSPDRRPADPDGGRWRKYTCNGCPYHHRHGPGGRGADGRHVRHHRRRRA